MLQLSGVIEGLPRSSAMPENDLFCSKERLSHLKPFIHYVKVAPKE
jgi:hypothetical protein